MSHPADKLILGSRSPRRLELLSLLLPRERIEVRAPSDPHEAGFDGLVTDAAIERRLVEIARSKNDDVVRMWFNAYYLGKTHAALTAVCLRTPDRQRHETVVRSEVTFRLDGRAWLDWYLATGEPLGKAGGYALQGTADVFVERIAGSPSNVAGLPLRETAELLGMLGMLEYRLQAVERR